MLSLVSRRFPSLLTVRAEPILGLLRFLDIRDYLRQTFSPLTISDAHSLINIRPLSDKLLAPMFLLLGFELGL